MDTNKLMERLTELDVQLDATEDEPLQDELLDRLEAVQLGLDEGADGFERCATEGGRGQAFWQELASWKE